MTDRRTLPELQTERLILRPFILTDAADVQRLAGDRDIASTTQDIPHPYEDGMAQEWISTHREKFEQGELVTLAVTLRDDGALAGAISLTINKTHERAELGYWVGKPYWNRGYCTEAARALLRYGFEQLHLNRIVGHHIRRNPSSGRVMQKLGMKYEGCLRHHVKKWDEFEDMECYGILRSDGEPR